LVLILGLVSVLRMEAIVDWYKNTVVKLRIKDALDDYLYDAVKKDRGIDLSEEAISSLIQNVILLAENNHELFS
jgi:hypothetical protein